MSSSTKIKNMKIFCGTVLAGVANLTHADLDTLESVGDDGIQSNTETSLGGKEKAQVLSSPQAVEVRLLGSDSAKR
jgi:hypothetical protein